MDKNIYELLNEVKVDFTEYENLNLSMTEKEAAKRRIIREVNGMKQNKRTAKKAVKWKMAAGIAAACALALTGIGAANPALAGNMFSSTFGRLIENAKGEKYEEEEIERYTKIGEKSVDVKEEVGKQQDALAYTTTANSSGVTISVSDVYCDGYMLYYTASLKTDHEGVKQADGIVAQFKDGETEKLEIEGMETTGFFSSPFEKAEDGTFVSADSINLMSDFTGGSFVPGEENTIVVNWTMKRLKGSLWDSWDEQGEYTETGDVRGEWHLRFPVTVDTSNNETVAVNKEENGITVIDAVRTKAGLVVHAKLPDFRKEPYNDPYNDPDIAIKDARGNCLQWTGTQSWDEHDDGTTDCYIMVLYDGEKDLTFEVTTKDEDAALIACIPFQAP